MNFNPTRSRYGKEIERKSENRIYQKRKLDRSLIEFVDEAHAYYSKDALSYGNRHASKNAKTLKYFPLLKRRYRGVSFRVLADSHGVSETTVMNMLMTTQNRVLTYLKIKEAGNL